MTPDELRQQILALASAGRKIDAIKLHREATGSGLAVAKNAVEAMVAGGPAPSFTLPVASSEPSDLEAAVIELLRGQRKIEAVKLYRERTKLGLSEAKSAVEAIQARFENSPSESLQTGAAMQASSAASQPMTTGPALSSFGKPAAPAFSDAVEVRVRKGFGSEDLDSRSPGTPVLGLSIALIGVATCALALVYFLYGR